MCCSCAPRTRLTVVCRARRDPARRRAARRRRRRHRGDECGARRHGLAARRPGRVFGTTFTLTAVLEGSGSKVASLWLPLAGEALFERPDEFQFAFVRVTADAHADAGALGGCRTRSPRCSCSMNGDPSRRHPRHSVCSATWRSSSPRSASSASPSAVRRGTVLALAERPRSVGLLRTLGFTPRSVRSVVVVRALLLTAAADRLLVLAVVWPLVARRGSFVLRSYTIDPLLSPATALLGFALLLASAWVGALVAAAGAAGTRAGAAGGTTRPPLPCSPCATFAAGGG